MIKITKNINGKVLIINVESYLKEQGEALINIISKIEQDKIINKFKIQIGFTIYTIIKEIEVFTVYSPDYNKNPFLDITNDLTIALWIQLEQASLINKLKIENYIFYGGFEQAERKILVIYPEKFNATVVEKNLSNVVKIIRIKLPDDLKGKYTHRDYLGAVIKLGVKREKVGDIIVDNDGADIIVDKDIVKFLSENLSGLTRFSKSTITVENIEDLRMVQIRKEEIEIIVSSLRLDNVISELARCSRNKALDIINMERVFINFQNETKKTKQIKPGDMITIRGKGRFFVKELVGQTRSGRTILKVEKFV